MKTTVLLLAAAILSACVSQPVISDFNGDSVKIQTNIFSSMADQRATADPEATRICKAGGRSRAEYVSYTSNSQEYYNTLLYLCLG